MPKNREQGGIPALLHHKSGARERGYFYATDSAGGRHRIYVGAWRNTDTKTRYQQLVTLYLASG